MPPRLPINFHLPEGKIADIAYQLLELAQQNPMWLFAAIAILPGFGFPASPLLILAGLIWGTGVEGCALAMGATIINMAWTHQIAAGPGHNILNRLIGERVRKWSQFGRDNPYRLITLLRITPGIPLCVQNYALGLLKVHFIPYIALSTILNTIFVCGFVIAGGNLFNGNFKYALIGVGVILIGSLIFKSLRHRIGTVPSA